MVYNLFAYNKHLTLQKQIYANIIIWNISFKCLIWNDMGEGRLCQCKWNTEFKGSLFNGIDEWGGWVIMLVCMQRQGKRQED